MQAIFRHDGNSIDHTPASAVAAGDVVVLGNNLVTVAKVDIEADRLGAVATRGVFDVVKDASDITGPTEAYWDADGDPVGGTAGSGAFSSDSTKGPFAGWFLEAAGTGVGTVRMSLNSVDGSGDASQDLAPYTIPLTSLRVHDAMATNLPATAGNDDMGLITGTPGTDAPTLQGVDFGGTATDEKGAFEFQLPPEYRAGETITVRVRGAMLTTVSDGTATVDVECWKAGDDGAAGSDICATAAQSINSLTPANKDFTITPTGLVAGDRLIVRVSFAGSDTGNAGVMIPEISKLQVLLDIKR
jgi:predicted RecA/RadA family phage recombinase